MARSHHLWLCRISRVSLTSVFAAINQFNKTLEKNAAETLFKLLLKYRPESKSQKRTRLLSEAEAREAGKVQLQRCMCTVLHPS
jgi:hypothetical protein